MDSLTLMEGTDLAMPAPKLSIITVCRNAVATIEATLESVLGQDYPDVEYIVVDGMSTDGTWEILERYTDRIDRIIREPDDGIYDAMNKGIAASTGDLVNFMNADDRYCGPGVLSTVAEQASVSPSAMVYAGDSQYETESGRQILRQSPTRITRWRFFAYNLSSHQAVFYRREALAELVGPYDTRYTIAADWEWSYRAFLGQQLPYRHLPFPVAVFTTGGLSMRNLEQRRREAWSLKRAYFSLPECLLYTLAKYAAEIMRRIRQRDFAVPIMLRIAARKLVRPHPRIKAES